jgi:cytochrome c peroxidase
MFTDGQPIAHGTRPHKRNTMTIIGTAYNRWLLWDGHKDSQWAQAVEPIENPDEQGTTRLHVIHLIAQDRTYRTAYEAVFGPLPADLSDFKRFPDSGGPVNYPPHRAAWESMTTADQMIATRIYVNVGKAIAAYERLILPGPTRFDSYVQAILEGDTGIMESALTPDEVAGLRLFIGQANCIQCHNGPLFTDNGFHNTGAPMAAGLPLDNGWVIGVQRVVIDEFNCLSQYSDATETDCKALRSLQLENQEQIYAFKTPTLRHIAETAPYMHAGQFSTLGEVLDHYNQAPTAPAGRTELKPLHFSKAELAQLEAFLRSLSALPLAPPELLAPPDD